MEARRDGARSDPPPPPVPGMSPEEQVAMFAGIVMQSPDGVVASDLDGTVVWANPAAAAMFARPREELLGRPLTEVLAGDAGVRFRAVHQQILTGDHTGPFVTTGMRGDGRTFELSVVPEVRRDAGGRPLGTTMILRDAIGDARLRRALREAERRLASQEAFFRGLHREAADVTLVADPSGALRYVTPSVHQVLGYEPDRVLDLVAGSLVHPDDLAVREARHRRVMEVPGARERGTVRLKDAQGRWRWFDTTATNCVEDPDIAGIVVNLREVTPEIEAQQALRDSEARYRAIAETAQEGILAVSPEGDTLFANERLAEILGLSMEEVYALGGTGILPAAELAPPTGDSRTPRPQAGPERSDVPYQHPDGADRVLHVSSSPLTAADGAVLGSLAMVSDVTDQRAAEETLRRQALHDALTGLPNRLLFDDRLTLAAARQERAARGAVAVLFLDLDHFKLVNDSHGHDAGDRLLVEVAARLHQAVRTTDTVARLGGDEFAVICEGADSATAALVSSRIQQAFKEPVLLDGAAMEVSVSIGVALSPPHQAQNLLRFADMAMYQAKATARGRVVTYDEGLPDDTTRHLGVLRALREALDTGSVPLAYRPVVDLRNGSVAGLASVIGWEHPTLGRLEPDETVRAAEAAGLVLDLDAAFVLTAARQLVELRTVGVVDADAFVRVRISPASARDPRLTAAVEEALGSSGLPPGLLELEIDADVALTDPAAVAALATRLRQIGVGLVMVVLGGTDDLDPANAEACLGPLRGLPFTGLQLERGVVERLTQLPEALAASREVVELAHETDSGATADGVSDEEQAALLREIGFDLATGNLWGSPLPPDTIAQHLPRAGA